MSTYLRLLRYLKPHSRIFTIAVISMAVSSVFGGMQIGAIIPIADRIVTNKTVPIPEWMPDWLAGWLQWLNGIDQLAMVTLFAFAIPMVFLLKGLAEFCQSFYMNDAAQRVIRDLRQELFDRFIHLSLDYHHKVPTGQTMSRILYDTSIVQNSITEGLTDLFFQSFQILISSAIALAIDWKLSLVIWVIVPLLAWPISTFGKRLKKISHQSQVVMGQLNATVLESITGIQIIKAFLVEQAARLKFAAANQRWYQLNRKVQKRVNLLSPLTEFIAACGGAFVFWFGLRTVLEGKVSLGVCLAFLLSILSLIRPFKRLARLHGVNQQAMASAERIFQVLDTPSSVIEHPKARLLPALEKSIIYEHVSFHYDSQPALRDVNLTIELGETIALVGPSGGGKTTLVNMIMRFYDPTSGRIKIDGTDIKQVTIASLRSQIGLVTQQPILFNDTVRANITLGNPKAEFTEIVEAAKMASAHEFISRLPKGYDTVIGERGEMLSGGERQRLTIARALLKNPRILIFDEATSQLDAQSEHLITQTIERLRKQRTVLVVAHRLSTVRLAHRIVLIQEGRIVEQGSHDELLQKSTLYQRFCELQLMGAGSKPPAD